MPGKKQKKETSEAPIASPEKHSCVPVALLIDGENVQRADLLPHFLAEAEKLGGVNVRRVYGNLATSNMQNWKKILGQYQLEAPGNNSGPNATDIALTIGAMDLFYHGYRHFCLVTGDRDYGPLVKRLKNEHCFILLMGTSAASSALKDASSSFLAIEKLPGTTTTKSSAPQPSKVKQISALSKTSAPKQFTEKQLERLLRRAYIQIVQEREDEWVLLTELKRLLVEIDQQFEDKTGNKKISTLIDKYPDVFEREDDEVRLC